jgi:formate dehydrogenase major subunit
MSKTIDRRRFLLGAGAAGAGGAFAGIFGLDTGPSQAFASVAKVRKGTVTSTICPFCGVGCGALVTAADGEVINIEGDPDHPINEGALCSKGLAMIQIANNDRRLTKVRYRAPGSSDWEYKDWDWAIDRIARNIKDSRDDTFEATDAQGRTVNRTPGIACLGGAALDNEECFAYSKFARSLGVVFLEHQARI